MENFNLKDLKRFIEKIEIEDNCWIWLSTINHRGYGRFNLNNKQITTHRLSYELFKGEIPEGYTIDHLCRNRLCCNPNHLDAVTMRENLMRSPIAPSSINASKTHCPKGHELKEPNLTMTGLRQGRRRCKICYTQKARLYQRKKAKERIKVNKV